jgi:hypothetical protein
MYSFVPGGQEAISLQFMKNGKATAKHDTRWPFFIAHLHPYKTATGILCIHIAY